MVKTDQNTPSWSSSIIKSTHFVYLFMKVSQSDIYIISHLYLDLRKILRNQEVIGCQTYNFT
jgi:hypothetical protein